LKRLEASGHLDAQPPISIGVRAEVVVSNSRDICVTSHSSHFSPASPESTFSTPAKSLSVVSLQGPELPAAISNYMHHNNSKKGQVSAAPLLEADVEHPNSTWLSHQYHSNSSQASDFTNPAVVRSSLFSSASNNCEPAPVSPASAPLQSSSSSSKPTSVISNTSTAASASAISKPSFPTVAVAVSTSNVILPQNSSVSSTINATETVAAIKPPVSSTLVWCPKWFYLLVTHEVQYVANKIAQVASDVAAVKMSYATALRLSLNSRFGVAGITFTTELFGSLAVGMSLPCSDVDLLLRQHIDQFDADSSNEDLQFKRANITDTDPFLLAQKVSDCVQSISWVQSVVCSRLPDVIVVKVTSISLDSLNKELTSGSEPFNHLIPDSLQFDISLETANHTGKRVAALLTMAGSAYPSFVPLMLVLKQILAANMLNQVLPEINKNKTLLICYPLFPYYVFMMVVI
jgi:hypothetical protein